MNDGYSKITVNHEEFINKPNAPAMEGQTITKKKTLKKIYLYPLIVIGIFIFFVFILGIVTFPMIKNNYAEAKLVYQDVKDAYNFVKQQDVVKGNEKLSESRKRVLSIQKSVQTYSWLGYLPVVNTYYKDGVHATNAAIAGIDAGQIVLEAIIPHADILGLKGQGSFVLGSAEERIQKTVQAMDKITPQIDELEKKLNLIRDEIDQINVNHYPELIVGKKVKNQINTAKSLIDQTAVSVADAKPLLETLPSLLGEPDEKKYLILFQNDKELRSTGGFITAFAVFRLEQGKIYPERSEDIYKLDESKTRNFPAPAPILKYHSQVYNWNLRDSNISPDFKESMKNFETIYASVSDKVDNDGIIAMDTHVLTKILEVLGPIDVSGITFSAEITAECNCPKVVYELEKYADEKVGYIKTDRKDIIGKLMYEIMKKALSSSPKLYWGKLFQVGLDELNQKHILFYFKDQKAQLGAESLNFAGRIKEFNGDYLHINDTNFAGAKSNMYVTHEVNQQINKESDGSITKIITIKYKNPQPGSDCNLESRTQLCLNGLLRNWVRLYVPKGSKLIESKGSEVKITTYEDLGKTVFDGFLTVRPQGQAQITFKYKPPFSIKDNNLPILMQKQPGTVGHKYSIDAGGKLQEFELTTDKEIEIKL